MATTKITSEVLDLNAGRADYSLSATNTVTYVGASGGNQYVFNGAYGTYGVVNGTYVLSSVSSSHPIAIINNGKTSEISYTGAVNEGTGTGPDGNTYTFYSGNVTITVSGNFDTVSYYCLNHGYMGGKDNLIYVSSVGESGLKIPSGTELNRPTAAAGQIRNNTNETSEFSASCEEYYNGTEWKKINNTALPPPLAFKALLYTGNGSTQSITGVGFQPDLVWIKSRSNTYGHRLIDSTTGPDKYLETNSTSMQQGAGGAGLTSFDSDGFSVGSGNAHNANGATFVAWNWKANPIPTIITDGGVQSVVSANTEAGFSIVKYEGNGSTQNIPHGLSAAPEFIIIKNLDSSTNWVVGSDEIAWNYSLNLNDSTAKGLSTNRFNSTAPTASVFSVGNTSVSNGSGVNYIAYCFHSVSGFSKISSYTGTGTGVSQSITGLGFSPNWVMIKETDGVDSWQVYDTDRGAGKVLYPNGNNAEYAGSELSSFDSDGFTVTGNPNESGKTYLYMAFKENPSPIVPAGQMAFLTVAGGGGGGTGYLYSYPAGGGGAGGLRTSFGTTSGGGSSAEPNTTLYSGTYTITVGAGAPGLSYNNYTQQQGGVSSIAHSSITTIESTGGGTGGTNGGNAGGQAGGSGGGSKGGSGGSGAGTANQGFGGGTFPGGSEEGGQGGGGASAAGSAGQTYNGGAGGNGLEVSITGSAVTYAGGGGGGGSRSFGGGGAGGSGGGGAATGNGSCCGNPGTANTGGAGAGGGGGSGRTGHGGTGYFAGGAGGSGIVVLRLQTAEYSGTTTGSPTVTTDGDYTILTYTGSGTYVHS